MGKARTPVAGWAVATAIGCLFGARAARGESRAADAFYAALHGDPEPVDAALLVAAPGRFVGRAVRTRARLRTLDANALRFDLTLGEKRARVQLEPEARAVLAARAAAWEGRTVEVDGLFYRDADGPGGDGFAMRVWRVRPLGPPIRRETAAPGEKEKAGSQEEAAIPQETPRPPQAPGQAWILSLEQLVYAAGRYDAQLVRVRGSYRGYNRHRDLPEASRRGRGDWVIKDGYFAAWIAGHDARSEGWDLTRRPPAEAEAIVDVFGVPTTAGGVVRIAARRVELAFDPDGVVAGDALATPRQAGAFATSPSLTFAYPVEGETLRPGGRMILQFNKTLDPRSLESRIRVRYERGGVPAAAPRVFHQYRHRNRALVVTPHPPPPPRTDVVVELLEGIIDVDGRALAPPLTVRFRSGP